MTTINKENLIIKLKRVPEVSDTPRTFTCNLCGSVFTQKCHMYRHRKHRCKSRQNADNVLNTLTTFSEQTSEPDNSTRIKNNTNNQSLYTLVENLIEIVEKNPRENNCTIVVINNHS
jgi:hypothetical protein